MRIKPYKLFLPCALLLTGCVLTPDFEMTPEQQAVIPEKWESIQPPHKTTVENIEDWWSTWNHKELSELIKCAMENNTSIKEAQENLRYYRAAVTVSGSSFFPSVSAEAEGGRTHANRTGYNNFGIGLNGAWTIDAGGIYASWLASKADLLSSEASLGDVQTEIAADVAEAYVNMRLAQRQLEVAQRNTKTQKEALDIAKWQYLSGIVESTDVDQAITSLEQTRSGIPIYQASIAKYKNALARLTSKQPSQIGTTPRKQIPAAPQNLALKIPADTLRQRPAVRAAEADVEAAMARHTAAKAALFPSLSIGGNIGLYGASIGALGNPGTQTSSILGTITLPIFNAGALRAQVEQQDAMVAAANARYEAALLSGIEEVEAALNDIWSIERKIKSLQTAVKSAVRAATNARQNYSAGLQDFTVVLTTQQTLLSVEMSLAEAQAQLATAFIELYKAMGGGWQVPEEFLKKDERKRKS